MLVDVECLVLNNRLDTNKDTISGSCDFGAHSLAHGVSIELPATWRDNWGNRHVHRSIVGWSGYYCYL